MKRVSAVRPPLKLQVRRCQPRRFGAVGVHKKKKKDPFRSLPSDALTDATGVFRTRAPVWEMDAIDV